MGYYIFLVVTLTGILTFAEVLFGELEAKQMKKINNYGWFLQFNNTFNYKKTSSTLFLFALLYVATSTFQMGSIEWILGLLTYLAIGIISNVVSTYLGFIYRKKRFKTNIDEVNELQRTIVEELKIEDTTPGLESQSSYNNMEIINEYMQEDLHLSIVGIDGGKFADSFEQLPPITYVVDQEEYRAKQLLENKGVKVTGLTQTGKLPFKEERIDLLINEFAHCDKLELFRVLKPGGYVVVEQKGSRNFNEVLKAVMPVRMKGAWDMENCQNVLRDIGFEIQPGYEDYGTIRFLSLSSTIHFLNVQTGNRFQDHRMFFNLYATIQQSIRNNGYFELSSHKFLVVARKPL